MREFLIVVILSALAVGCAGGRNAVAPQVSTDLGQYALAGAAEEGPYRLWGEWTFFIDETHNRVDAVPLRQGRFHLNALKFLESYCADCLQVLSIKNNGDSTVDLTVKIKHPFPGHPEYTGFDVKGIVMFEGSSEIPGIYFFPPSPEPFRASWRLMGDPQLLNPDGYTLRWSPSYDSGSDLPIFNYWVGKYASGTPTANLNAYLNFYTDPERHMFRDYGQQTRTYTIWLPPGEPVVAGYAVEACWEPPTKTPVTDPEMDFPITANQPEAYEFYVNINNGQPITDPDCCGDNYDPSEGYMFSKQWGGHTALHFAGFMLWYKHDACWAPCGDEWPDQYCSFMLLGAGMFPDGEYMGVGINYHWQPQNPHDELAYTLFEFTIDLE